MDAMTLLESRVSSGNLLEPAPDATALRRMLGAALRAPDHKGLEPYRFIAISGDDRLKFGELQLSALLRYDPQATERDRDKAKKGPLRAPMILVVVVRLQAHPTVPEAEQRITSGCAALGVLLAAQALGYGGIWRTGPLSRDLTVHHGLGLAANEEISGLLYLGTPEAGSRRLQERQPEQFLTHWNASIAEPNA